METTFRLSFKELTPEFFKTVRQLYNKKNNLLVTVKNADEMDETEYLLASDANRKMLEQSLKNVEEGKLIEADIDKYLKK